MFAPVIRVLGHVELGASHDPLPRKQAQVIALLALNVNRPVAVERLVAAVWERPTESSRANLRSHVAMLRKRLAGSAVILRHGSGYLLDVEPALVDEARFRGLAAGSLRATGPAQVVRYTGDALALWRGPALDGVRGTTVFDSAAAELEEARRMVLARHLAARLALGEHETLIPAVRAEMSLGPLQEQWYVLLLKILAALGRASEGMAVYTELCERMADELGLMPSEEVRTLYARMVSGDRQMGRRVCGRGPARRARRPCSGD
ncbi:hypothetical protein GCM10027589_50100 [Actinocorallia lasiicapitis]